jgi:hypothetical protein
MIYIFIKIIKRVVLIIFYDILSSIALAHWIMGEGAIFNKGLVLCTDNFTLQEVINLRNVLQIKYNINLLIKVGEMGDLEFIF